MHVVFAVLTIIVLAALHFAASFFLSFAAGITAGPSLWKLASQILTFPLWLLPANNSNALLGWLLWALLSLA